MTRQWELVFRTKVAVLRLPLWGYTKFVDSDPANPIRSITDVEHVFVGPPRR